MEFKTKLPCEIFEKKTEFALEREWGGIVRRKSDFLYAFPNRLLALIKEGDFSAERGSFLQGDGFKIFFNKEDLMIEGCKVRCHAVKIKLTENFFDEEIYFAKGENSRKEEERIRRVCKIWEKGLASRAESLSFLNSLAESRETALFEDWEILRLRQSFCKDKISGGEND